MSLQNLSNSEEKTFPEKTSPDAIKLGNTTSETLLFTQDKMLFSRKQLTGFSKSIKSKIVNFFFGSTIQNCKRMIPQINHLLISDPLG